MVRHLYSLPAAILAFIAFSANIAAKTPPNVIIIFCDDMGYGEVSDFGFTEPLASTPNIDRMAAEGVKLTRFMVTMPYCAPSRASLLTGCYPFEHGVTKNPAPDSGIDDYGLDLKHLTIPELLKAKDYNSYLVGKWHLGHTEDRLMMSSTHRRVMNSRNKATGAGHTLFQGTPW